MGVRSPASHFRETIGSIVPDATERTEMRKLSVPIGHEVERRLQEAADSHRMEPETLASELIEQVVLTGDLLERIAARHEREHSEPEPGSVAGFDEGKWERAMAGIQEVGKELPKFAPRSLTTSDYYPDEG